MFVCCIVLSCLCFSLLPVDLLSRVQR
uniref:Uncharacterized protein n=1 Tax=Arundo donax TaxID=35708 RepID=A0A0A9F5F7_ARUDO